MKWIGLFPSRAKAASPPLGLAQLIGIHELKIMGNTQLDLPDAVTDFVLGHIGKNMVEHGIHLATVYLVHRALAV